MNEAGKIRPSSYIAKNTTRSVLGVYGIARNFSEKVMFPFQRINNLLIFPKIAGSSLRRADQRRPIAPTRIIILGLIAVGLSMGMAVADAFTHLVHDQRYHVAGFFLTVLLLGTWLSTLATMSDTMMMGVWRPLGDAFGNGAKLAVIVSMLPYLLGNYGLNVALAVVVFAEVVRYVVLIWQKRCHGIGFTRQDIIATVIFILLALLFREFTMLIGLTGGVSDWIIQAQTTHV